MMPLRSLLIMASSDDSTMAASRCARNSGDASSALVVPQAECVAGFAVGSEAPGCSFVDAHSYVPVRGPQRIGKLCRRSRSDRHASAPSGNAKKLKGFRPVLWFHCTRRRRRSPAPFCHRSSNIGLDIRPNFSYETKSRSSRDAFRMRSEVWSECGASARARNPRRSGPGQTIALYSS
jgi:hypothetical protein